MNQPQLAPPAELYERHWVPAMFVPTASLMLDHAALRRGERVLDVACGTGIVSRMAAPFVGREGQVTGLDIAPHMLAVAKSRPAPAGAAIEWREGDAMNLPFADGTFDAVMSQHGLGFIPDNFAAVREMRRVLKAGGRAVVCAWRALELHPVYDVMCRSVARHVGVPLSETDFPFVLGDAGKFRSLFTAAKFSKVEILERTITARFPGAEQYTRLAVATAPAANPGFRKLHAQKRAEVLDAVHADVEPVVRQYRDGDSVSFPMFAHIAVATA